MWQTKWFRVSQYRISLIVQSYAAELEVIYLAGISSDLSHCAGCSLWGWIFRLLQTDRLSQVRTCGVFPQTFGVGKWWGGWGCIYWLLQSCRHLLLCGNRVFPSCAELEAVSTLTRSNSQQGWLAAVSPVTACSPVAALFVILPHTLFLFISNLEKNWVANSSQ